MDNIGELKAKSGLDLEDWMEMLAFLNKDPSRNQNVHETFPPNDVVRANFSALQDKMKINSVRGFATLMKYADE
jgi:hypothetical protein